MSRNPESLKSGHTPGGVTSSLNLTERRSHNAKQPINELPDEVLGRIFIVTTESSIRPRGAYRFTLFPDTAIQVCSRWMQVALATPSLWAHIHIREHLDDDDVALWVSRAGPDTLLDIEIDILEPYCGVAFFEIDNWDEQEFHASRIFKFFRSLKAGPHRWRSLSLSVLQPEPLYKFIQLLNKQPAPNMRYLYLNCEPDWNDDEFDEERPLTNAHYRKGYSLSEHAVPNLRDAELTYVSWKYIFDRPKPLLSGLTTLKLSAGSLIPSLALSNIQKLLLANPNLETLDLSAGSASDYDFDRLPDGERPNPVRLSSLKTLSISGEDNISFAWDILWIIGAPSLENLSLSSGGSHDDEFAVNIADYIITGQIPGSKNPITAPTSNPLFPLLKDLHFSISLNPQKVADVLSSLPHVTRLAMHCHGAKSSLGIAPHILPQLEVLSLNCFADHQHYQGLEDIFTQRALDGIPIRVLEIPAKPQPEPNFEERFPKTVLRVRKD